MKKLLLAMGSEIIMDEAVSIMLARDLKKSFPDFELQVQAAGGMELIGLLTQFDLAVIMDTLVATDAEAGKVNIFSGYGHVPTLHLQNPHDTGFSDSLKLAGQLDYRLPDKIVVLAIGIKQQMTASPVLSPQMGQRYESLLDECREIISRLFQAGSK